MVCAAVTAVFVTSAPKSQRTCTPLINPVA
jgi:hypothetical protein